MPRRASLDGMRHAAMLALLLVVPLADASWSAFGGREPSTADDDARFMWPDPTTDASQAGRIYFNVIATIGTARSPFSASPNVAALGSAIAPVGVETHVAWLGIWMDCNRDGYVGAAETAAREYPATMLNLQAGASGCPFASGSEADWKHGRAHNYNGWVTEFIPILPAEPADDKRVFVDPDARVWGDHGRPGGPGSAEPDIMGPITTPVAKTEATWNFIPVHGHRGSPPGSLLGEGGRAGPDELAGLAGGSFWSSDSILVRPTPPVSRGEWSTFYAHVGERSTGTFGLDTPSGGSFLLYGNVPCEGTSSGIRNGWNCDRDAWYRAWDGTPTYEPHSFARPGDRYELRDVDCYDGRVGDTGSGVQPAFYSARSCARG